MSRSGCRDGISIRRAGADGAARVLIRVQGGRIDCGRRRRSSAVASSTVAIRRYAKAPKGRQYACSNRSVAHSTSYKVFFKDVAHLQ
eukprot:274595-Pyramimonas_sp.AAC.1